MSGNAIYAFFGITKIDSEFDQSFYNAVFSKTFLKILINILYHQKESLFWTELLLPICSLLCPFVQSTGFLETQVILKFAHKLPSNNGSTIQQIMG